MITSQSVMAGHRPGNDLGRKAEVRTSSSSLLVVMMHLFVMMMACMAYFARAELVKDAEIGLRVLSAATLMLFVWSLYSWKLVAGTLFHPYCVFLVLAYLFNCGQAFLYAVGMLDGPMLGGEFDDSQVLDATLFVALCLGSFHLGALAVAALPSLRLGPRSSHSIRIVVDPSALRLVGLGMLVVSFPPYVLMMRDAVQTVLTSGYAGLYRVDEGAALSSGVRTLTGFLIPSSIFLLASDPGSRKVRLLTAAVVGGYTATYFFLGYRGIAAMPLIAYAWSYHRLVRPLGKQLVVPALVLAFVVMPTIGAARVGSPQDGRSLAMYVETFLEIENPINVQLTEMGGSLNTVVYTQMFVPEGRAWDRGSSYLDAVYTVIPSLFWSQHPALANGTLMQWVSYTARPWLAASGGGLGYSFIAEAYINFGWWGGIVCMLFIGLILGSIFTWGARSNEVMPIAIVASFLSFLAYYARGEALYVVRPLVWYILMPALIVVALSIPRIRPLRIHGMSHRAASSVSDG